MTGASGKILYFRIALSYSKGLFFLVGGKRRLSNRSLLPNLLALSLLQLPEKVGQHIDTRDLIPFSPPS